MIGAELPCLLVFARRPVPGRVKTRLIARFGAAGATALHLELLRLTLKAAAQLSGVSRELWWDRAGQGNAEKDLAARFGMAERQQVEGDLGVRMHSALASALARAPAAVLIGSDCPGQDTDYLRDSFGALVSHDAVIGPAADGGYVLIGLRRPEPRLFADMPWGSTQILAWTRERLTALGWRWQELAPRHDVDCPEDLANYPELRLPPALGPR